jgi:hypothetical protein
MKKLEIKSEFQNVIFKSTAYNYLFLEMTLLMKGDKSAL